MVATNYDSMPIQQIISRREDVIKSINSEVQALNRQFRRNALELDTDKIQELFQDLKEINQNIEARKNEFEFKRKRGRCCGLQGVSTVTWISIGVEFLAAILLGIGEITSLVASQKLDDKISDLEKSCNTTISSAEIDAIEGLSITQIVIIVLAAGLLVPLAGAVKQINNDKDKAHLLMEILEIKEQGKEIRDFLTSFQQFKHSVSPKNSIPEQTQQESFSHCVHCLDHLPEKGFREHIPSRDHWISLMVQLLPEDHPIKEQLRKMRDAALSQVQPESTSDDEKEEETDSSSSPRRKFRGERMTFSYLRTPRIESSDPIQILDTKFKKKYQKKWFALEESLGIHLHCVQLDDVALGRNTAIAPDISYFGATFPVELEDEEIRIPINEIV
ncbi:hypothetical protein [Waddlia chondrophila]|uniref:Putative membrane protein n=1 Tax=Waddlia chondrophila (strain ATCC VR-1470 / WSU 86-1044) TaxID=716544 RepID=D6YW04_WADCW|nr:hypothetical protein [Waddlia chondrophila]ADI38315.1 putative membrane protein [Waddlia chondrophila WSU 86-1044]